MRAGLQRATTVSSQRSARGGMALRLGGVALSPQDEVKHFKFVGTTGTGKSTAIRQLLAGALARGDRAIIADPDGAYLARFYDRYRGDAILNPFEPYTVAWSPFAEGRAGFDFDELARGFVPDAQDPAAQEWRGYARAFLASLLRRCSERGTHDPAEFWRLLATASVSEVRAVVSGTPAQPFLDPDNLRMFCSIRSVTVATVAALEHIRVGRSPPFSVRDFVRNGRGILFLPYRAGQIATLKAMIATWIRLAIYEGLGGTPDKDLRLWFVLDELDAIGAIDGLKDALSRLRKFGGRCVLGFQSTAQIWGTYGDSAARTIVENCANTLILRCSGSAPGGTSHFTSQLIGEREVIRRQTSRGSERGQLLATPGARRSRHVSDQHATEVAVLPAELEQLPDLTGYLKTASSGCWVRIRLAPDA